MIQKIEISSRTIIFTVFFLLFLKVVWMTRELFYGLFIAFIFMSALKPAVNSLSSRKMPRPLAAVVVFLTALVGILFAFSALLPPVIIESISFIRTLPMIIVNALPFLSRYLSADSFIAFLPNVTDNVVKIVTGLFSNVVFVISVLFFTFYFILEEQFLDSLLRRFLEKEQADLILKITAQAESRMSAWVWGELLLMTIIGVFTYIGLTLLNIPFALPLAFIAGLLEVVPILGPTISAIPAFFVASSTSLLQGGVVIILYIVIQQLENNVVVPIVMRKAIGMHPIVTLMALTIGGKLGGFIGILLSVPLALLAETVFFDLVKQKK